MASNGFAEPCLAREQTASIVAIALPCCFFFPMAAVLAVASLFVLAAWRWPALVAPLFCILGVAAIVSQLFDAYHGDAVSRWWITILVTWLIFLCFLALFDDKQKVLGAINRHLSIHANTIYLAGASARILLSIAYFIGVPLLMLKWDSPMVFYGFLLSILPMGIISLVTGVKMLRTYKAQTSKRA